MPKLDARLIAVTKLIRAPAHCDIGSDHGGLLKSLLSSGRIRFGIAIENKPRPFENSRRALAGLNADVRLGDGLEPLRQAEVQSLSICGMGAANLLGILSRFPDRLPKSIVLQPNHEPELVRRWAWDQHYHVAHEQIVGQSRRFPILAFRKAEDQSTLDPAYAGLDLEAAILFGPIAMKQASEAFRDRLTEESRYWRSLDRLEPARAQRLELVERVMRQQGWKQP